VRRTAVDALGDVMRPGCDDGAEVDEALERLVTLIGAFRLMLAARPAAGG
jgi:hypothetical protein